MPTAADFKELHDEIDAMGAFDAPTFRSWAKFFGCAAVTGVGVVWALENPGPGPLLAMLPLSVVLSACVMVGHEGGHNSACNSKRANNVLIHLAFGVMGGVSSIFWKHKHNVLHHGNPNDPEKDLDLLLGPVAVSKEQHDSSNGFKRWFQTHVQHWAVWVLSGFLAPLMRTRGAIAMGRHLKAKGPDGTFWADAVSVTLHFVLWIALPLMYLQVSLLWTLAVWFTIWYGVGVMLGVIFLPGHTGMPLVETTPDRWSQQVLTSRSIKLSRPMAFFWVGLENQLEHHLFPKVSHMKMGLIKPVVKRWSAKHGMPYEDVPFWTAFLEVVDHLRTSWTDVPVPLELAPRAVAQEA